MIQEFEELPLFTNISYLPVLPINELVDLIREYYFPPDVNSVFLDEIHAIINYLTTDTVISCERDDENNTIIKSDDKTVIINFSLNTVSYLLNDKLHNSEGPAFIKWDINGFKIFEKYCKHGTIHNENGLAISSWYSPSDGGLKKSEEYYINGVNHNENGPSATYWYKNGNICEMWYHVNGVLHNTRGPAVNSWYDNTTKHYEEYYINGKTTNTDGPAFTAWHKNGNISLVVFKLNNKWKDRGDLPNQIEWHENGVKAIEWYITDNITFRKYKHDWSYDLLFFMDI